MLESEFLRKRYRIQLENWDDFYRRVLQIYIEFLSKRKSHRLVVDLLILLIHFDGMVPISFLGSLRTVKVGPLNLQTLRTGDIRPVSKKLKYPTFRLFILMVSFRFLFGIGEHIKSRSN